MDRERTYALVMVNPQCRNKKTMKNAASLSN
jgi:hypothetical protein